VNAAGNALVAAGSILMLLAALGVLRLPDVLARLQAGTKAASLGLAFAFAGAALLQPSLPAVVKLALAMLFVFATAPVAAHVIGRAAYQAGVPLWKDTWIDESPPDMVEDQTEDGRPGAPG
jgi:multicomponent Na+:H+ antiporter subunit G